MEIAIFILLWVGVGFITTVIEDNTEALLTKSKKDYEPQFHTPWNKIITIFLWPIGIFYGYRYQK